MQIEINDMQAMLIIYLLPKGHCKKCPFYLPCDDYDRSDEGNGDFCDDLRDKIVKAWGKEHGEK